MTVAELLDYIQEIFDQTLHDALEDVTGRVNEDLSEAFDMYFAQILDEKLPEGLNRAIKIFLTEHAFRLPDGTTIEEPNHLKILSPDKKDLVSCYGRLHIDKDQNKDIWYLIVQTGYDRWTRIAEYDDEEKAVDALLKVKDAMDAKAATCEL